MARGDFTVYSITEFNRSGLAALSDLNIDKTKYIFAKLERDQSSFLEHESFFRSKELPCSKDPLHQWSRAWEYPYVYYHLSKMRSEFQLKNKFGRVVDFGSGVSFFPFSAAQLGFHVNCIDVDPVVQNDILRAKQLIDVHPGKIEFYLSNGEELPFEDSSIDVIYSISVLEHIDVFENVLTEFIRIIIPGGFLLLTFDLAGSGEGEIKVERYQRLREFFLEYFDFEFAEKTIHPADTLHSSTGPYPIKKLYGAQRRLFELKQLVKPVLGKKPLVALRLYVYGCVLKRKSV
jgi:SAM-dependent methyltransferase